MRPINQTPQSADGAYERETIINFCDAEKTCSYYTRNYSRMNELRKLATEHPDEVKLTIDKEDCVEAEFPKKWVKCPKISAMWSAKNTYTPSEVSVGSNKKAWFVCPDCKQEFEARVFHIARSLMRGNTGCPVCAGRKVVPGINDLATQCPKVVPLWSDKNDYTPSEISARSERRAIFVCPDCKKEFVTSVRAMTRAIASGATCCPDCKMRMRTISAARKDEHDYVKSVGTTMTMKNGSKATCIAYHGVNNITVEFEDGFVLYHARWNQFVRGALHHNQKNINE